MRFSARLATWWKRMIPKKTVQSHSGDPHELRESTQELALEHHTPVTFESLANELVQEIIRLVPHPLTSLSLCSKRLHNLTEPIMYANVSLWHKNSYPLFIRTIACRPDLTSHVRHFQTSSYTADWDFDLDFLEDKRWVRQSLPRIFGEEAYNHWFREIFAFRPQYRMLMAVAWDAITAFLLCLFSAGLRSIDMKPYGLLVAKYSHIDMVLEQVARDQSMVEPITGGLLPNLRSVSIEGPQQRALTVKFVLPFLKVKSISSVRLSRLRSEGSADFELPPVLETTDLAILDSSLAAESVQRILSLFHSLKRFQYQYGATQRERRVLYNSSIIKEGLVNSRNTLEQLIISDERYEPNRPWKVIPGSAIGSLHEFTRLRIIKADVFVLLGEEKRALTDNAVSSEFCRSFRADQCFNFVHSLPRSLEHLTIWKNTIAILDGLKYMFPSTEYVLPPHFKSLTLFFRKETASPSDLEMEEWAGLALTSGVMLKWERTPHGLPIDE